MILNYIHEYKIYIINYLLFKKFNKLNRKNNSLNYQKEKYSLKLKKI